MIQAFSTHQNSPHISEASGPGAARRAAEALFQSSEKPATVAESVPVSRPQRRPGSGAIRAQANIVSIRRYVVSRLLEQGRFSQRLEFVELPRIPGKPVEGEQRSPVFLLIFGPQGRTLYLALEDGTAAAASMPSWWERLNSLGHVQRRVRGETAIEAWRLIQICLRKSKMLED